MYPSAGCGGEQVHRLWSCCFLMTGIFPLVVEACLEARDSRAVAHPLMGKPFPGASAGLVAGRAGSWSLIAAPRDP